ncbi:MAG TPA: peptidylprolyl isomerase [Pirellulales bacterium]|nr:peptidylprolyl isomerase [Pirellulales bacterium]
MSGRFFRPFSAMLRARRKEIRKQPPGRRSRLESLESRTLLANDPIVTVDTNFGNFQIQLYPSAAPQTVANFLTYVDDGAYNDAIFHRSVPGFVEQTGGFLSPTSTFSGSTSQFTPITTNSPIPLEYNVPNTLGTVAMARGSTTNSATSQWFVNLADNTQSLGTSNGGGYAVFGQVLDGGMSVLNAIAALPVDNVDNGTFSQLPVSSSNQLARITSVTVDSIDGTVFTDVNGNAQFDVGESGLAGRTVFLNNDGSGVPDANNPSTTTDANGNYHFSGLAAGSYTVAEVLPANASLTTPLQTATVSADHTASGVNFGERVAVEGFVFQDANGNGGFDPGELPVSGRTVFLNIDGSGVPDANNPSTTTNANGVYYFANLAPGSYSVTEVVPTGVTLTTPATRAVVVQAGQTTLNVNFGEQPPALNNNQKYVDQLYHDLLNRSAEPAASQYWSNLIAGGQTRAQVALQIEDSPEYEGDIVTGLYQLYLHRAPEASALATYTALLIGGATPKQLAMGLVSSAEYFQNRGGGTNQGFMSALFGDVLHRSVDAVSAAAVAPLDFSQEPIRLTMADAIFSSTEYLQDLVSYPGAPSAGSGYVTYGWYQAYLGRDADSTAIANGVTALQAGTSEQLYVANILGTDEYFARAQNGV